MNKFVDFLYDAIVKRPLKSAKFIIPLAALLALILSDIEIKAIVVLNNELCSFTLFMFTLIGLACIFNALRIKPGISLYSVFSVLLIVIAMVLGVVLVFIYSDAIKNQPAMDANMKAAVRKGIILIIVFLLFYLLGLIQTIRGVFSKNK